MANELNYYGKINQTGLTVIAKVYDKTGARVGNDISCSEAGSLAIYIGDMPTAGEGEYGVRFFSGSILLGQGVIHWSGTEEITAGSWEATEKKQIRDALGVDGDKKIAKGGQLQEKSELPYNEIINTTDI